MQKSAGRVPVITGREPERSYDRLQTAHVFGQLRGTNSGVFDERHRFCRPDAPGQKRQTGFTHGPHEIHLRRIGDDLRAHADFSRLQDRQPFRDFVVKLDD